jgi:hypothetical protein
MSIRRVDVQRYITKRAGDVSAHSVQKELNVLKHLLRLAVEWEVVPFNVAHGVKCPRVPAGRVRYLQPGELRSSRSLPRMAASNCRHGRLCGNAPL